ncbi:hypothetical protein [Butyrivibrio sp. WCD2001]|uniref:hypothetical protein n=1 Tax=Butyrivibrio sp. WCD2001 TaxID=1280681 RepID=UPI00042A9357|nr:hypothetical protein [Butyrivibrio sp. WCD2001]
MKKSIVRKLAFTLVLVLMLRTFVSDYNSIGVRADEGTNEEVTSVEETVRLSEVFENTEPSTEETEIAEVPAAPAEEPEAPAEEPEQPAEEPVVTEEPQTVEEPATAPSAEEGNVEEAPAPAEGENVAPEAAPDETPANGENGETPAEPEAPAAAEEAAPAAEEPAVTPAEGGETVEEAPAVEKGMLVVSVIKDSETIYFDTFNQDTGAEVTLTDYFTSIDPTDEAGNVDITEKDAVAARLTEGFYNWAAANVIPGENKIVEWNKISHVTGEKWFIEGAIIDDPDAPVEETYTPANTVYTQSPSDGNAEGTKTEKNETSGGNGSGNTTGEGETSGGNTEVPVITTYNVKIFISDNDGKYTDDPSFVFNSTDEVNPFGNLEAVVDKSLTLTPENNVSLGNTIYRFDKENKNNVTTIDKVVDNPNNDPDTNVFVIYYKVDPKSLGKTKVAYYVLLPNQPIPANSTQQDDKNYYPEMNKGYSYEKWLGTAQRDLYAIPDSERDGNGNVWDPTGARINAEIDTVPTDLIDADFVNDDVLKKYKVLDETTNELRSPKASDITWYVYKNVGDKAKGEKAYHIDGYINRAYVTVRYHANYPKDVKGEPDVVPFEKQLTGSSHVLKEYSKTDASDDKGVFTKAPEGYSFLCWMDKDGKYYDPGDSKILMSDTDFYAVWLPDSIITIIIKIKAASDQDGRDTYIKYDGSNHRGNMDVDVVVDTETIKNALAGLDLNSSDVTPETKATSLSEALQIKALSSGKPVALNDGAAEEDKVFAVDDKRVEVNLDNGIKFNVVVSGLTVSGGYGKHVLPDGAGYPITVETKNKKITVEGLKKDISDKFKIVFDSGISVNAEEKQPTSAVIGHLYILPREVELVSPSAEKLYDGTPLTATDITVGADGFATGDSAEYTDFASQTEVGSTPNTFNYKLVNVVQPLDYSIKQVTGTLTVKENPQSDPPKDPETPEKPDKPKKHNKNEKPDKPKKTNHYDPTPNNDNPPTEEKKVLGAIRPMNGSEEKGEVLGSRRGATEDSTNTARLFVLIGAAAALAILLFVGKKKKREVQ